MKYPKTVFINQNYIMGEWVDGEGSHLNLNPSDLNDNLGHYAQASLKQAEQAIEGAGKAYGRLSLEERYQALMSIGSELMERCEEIGFLLAREEGKTKLEGKGEVYRSGQFFHYFAAEVLRQIGDTADSVRPGVEVDVRREPVGVVVVISPWNFPMATASWKIAPALAFGNSVIWKPANLTPATAGVLTEIISRQNLPQGLFQLVMGEGKKVGGALIQSPLVDAISFTGSLEVGEQIAQTAAKNLTRFQLEMGSKNPLVVMDDAQIDTALNAAIGGAYGSTGQKCTASSRLLIHEKVYDHLVDSLIDKIKHFKVGHALQEGTDMGPVVSEAQLESNLNYVALAKKEGCELAFGGKKLTLDYSGYYMEPTLFLNSDNQMKINREEIFGPICAVIKIASLEEAVEIANDTSFGLTSGIVTQSLANAHYFRRHSKTGCVMVNLPTAGTDYHVPFGGRKKSSFGPREQGSYAKEFYTVVKTAYILSN